MAISKKSIEQMAKLLGVDKAKITEAMDSKTDVDIEIGEVKVFTVDGLAKFESEKVEVGRKAGIEVAVKNYKKDNGLEFPGKDISDLVQYFESKSDVDGKVKKLQENIITLTKEKESVEGKLSKVELLTDIHNAIPAEYNKMSKKELQAIAEANGFDFKKENGKLVAYRNGEKVVEEMTQKEVDAKTALTNFFEGEKGFKVGATATDPAPPKGRGGQSDPSKGGNTVSAKRSEIEKAWTDANSGKSINGEEYASHFASKVKELKEAGQAVIMD